MERAEYVHRLHLSSLKRLKSVTASILDREDAVRCPGNQNGLTAHVKGAVGTNWQFVFGDQRNQVFRLSSNRVIRLSAVTFGNSERKAVRTRTGLAIGLRFTCVPILLPALVVSLLIGFPN